MNVVDVAIEFAATAHQSQYRKGSGTPYISHPFGVAMLLSSHNCSEEVIVAALLHDVLEDTDTTEQQLAAKFGPQVTAIVKSCSEPDKTLSWEERKTHTIESIPASPIEIRLVACADKLHNLRSMKRDYEAFGPDFWARFKRGEKEQSWYYKSLAEAFDKADDSSQYPLFAEFAREVKAFFS
ncbi:HD domain-containing protein [Paenibacillus glycanilyticus]|uniref:HD domain-containing protein n=1 Tax=Paenibacillus glycanilyticus TaxID=126569 RepID=UPI002041950B|nr:HD domain-containing protein [Paenibacillus glycanilyticus]MCM3629648.1 HD domain-containing protein [Paenibacillus glycanilyticus]